MTDPREATIEQESADWYARREMGFTSADQDAFFQWLAVDPRHGEWFARHQQAARSLQRLAHWRPEHAVQPNPDLLAVPSRPAFLLRATRWLAPAGLAAAIAWVTFLTLSHREAVVEPSAGSDPILRKVLEDGSTIDLNHGAQVEVSYTADARSVHLLQGEAIFHVAKNPDRPFTVTAASVSVRAVGTAFNVNLRAKAVEVLVTEGRVQVSPPAVDHGTLVLRGIPVLEEGYRAVVPLNASLAPIIESVPPAEIARLLHWQPRQLEFTDAPLAQVAAEFNRDNRTKIVIDDPALAALPIGASLRSDNVEGFVRLLESSFGVTADRRRDGVIVLRRAQ